MNGDRIDIEHFHGIGWNTPEHDNPVGSFQGPLLQAVSLIGELLCELRNDVKGRRYMPHPADNESQHTDGCTEYVLGFAFGRSTNEQEDRVVMIHKNRPEWQAGKVNGVGGHVEPEDHCPHAAMVREFKEETGVRVAQWEQLATMSGEGWVVHCFSTRGIDLRAIRTMTDEPIRLYRVSELICGHAGSHEVISNIPWLIALALDGNHRTYRIDV